MKADKERISDLEKRVKELEIINEKLIKIIDSIKIFLDHQQKINDNITKSLKVFLINS